MLLKNPLLPPGPLRGEPTAVRPPIAPSGAFISADDFDVTGMLTGMDCCESRYWWMPELQAERSMRGLPRTADHGVRIPDAGGVQAAARTVESANAAA